MTFLIIYINIKVVIFADLTWYFFLNIFGGAINLGVKVAQGKINSVGDG